MTRSISLTLPMEHGALVAGAEMLQKLAADIESEQLGAPHHTAHGVTDCNHDHSDSRVVSTVAQLGHTDLQLAQALASVPTTLSMIDETPDSEEGDEGTATPPPAGVTVDKTGIPWDERIHSGGENKLNKDGTWRKRKNIAPEVVATVEAELRLLMQAGAPITPTIAPPPAVVEPVIAPPPAAIAPPPVIAAPPAPVMTAPSAPVGLFAAAKDWPSFMQLVTSSIPTKVITAAEILDVLKSFGIQALPLLAKRPDLIPKVGEHIDALIASKKA